MKALYLTIAIIILANGALYSFSGDGSGTPFSPYQITDVYQLQEMEDNLEAYYILMNDIDASKTVSWNEGDHDQNSETPDQYMGFISIGSNGSAASFQGVLDGNNKRIYNLYMNSQYGFFRSVGAAKMGLIMNLGLVDCAVTSLDMGGVLAARVGSYGVIRNCYVYNSILNGGSKNVGGLVGINEGLIISSYSSCIITANTYCGGFAGANSGRIYNSYAMGKISGTSKVGGFVGENTGYIITSFSTTLLLNAGDECGGFSGGDTVNGIKGCFWNVESSSTKKSFGGTGITGIQLQDKTILEKEGWNLTYIWELKDNYYPKHNRKTNNRPTDFDDDGYLDIWGLDQLQWLSESGEGSFFSYELNGDIDATETKDWHSGAGFLPIPNFSGSFNGNGYAIKNLNIDYQMMDNVGLFGVVIGGDKHKICNLKLTDCSIEGRRMVGGIVGYNESTAFDSISVSGIVKGRSDIGLLGGISKGELKNIHVVGEVRCDSANAGGVVGSVAEASISYTSSSATISGQDYIGGAFGRATACNIDQVYTIGDINGNRNVGGIAGYSQGASFYRNSFSRCEITANQFIGGIIGSPSADAIVLENLYYAGRISGSNDFAPLFSNKDYEAPVNCFWDKDICNYNIENEINAKTTIQMKKKSTFTDAGWDFDSVWALSYEANDGYPNLEGLNKVGVHETAEQRPNIKIYPNPTSDFINVVIPENEFIVDSYSLMDISGGTIRQGALAVAGEEYRINVEGLPKGYYILRLRGMKQLFDCSVIVE